MMARAATSGELAKFRSSGQHSKLYLAIEHPATVFTCRVNQSFDTTDSVTEITYDGGTGTYTDILPGMTLLVGSAAGLDDYGQCRVRAAATDTIIYIGETSEIAWTDNLYITVIDEFGFWAKHLTIDGNTPRMDYDIEYSNQHDTCDPIPVMGPDAVLWLTDASVNYTPDASDSWVINSTIASYLWACADASATADVDTATPTITFDTAGEYRVSCTVTSADGASFTGYRRVFVFELDDPPTVQLENCAGEYDAGGWSFSISMYENITTSDIRDRAKAILFARDWYGGTEGSVGPVSDYENIICEGWIDGESIEWDADFGKVRFTVHGAQFWLSKIPGYPTGVKDTDSTPTGWLFFDGLTVDAGLWHFLHWRSTATAIMDITLTGDDRLISATEAPAGSLWQQLQAIAYQTILAKPLVDRFGRLFVEIGTQYLPVADRSSIPAVQAITSVDWLGDDGIQFERRTVPDVSLLELSGVNYDGTTATPMMSRAPGNVYRRYGRIEALDRLLFADQTSCNEMAGLILANMNNPYPSILIPLAANQRLFDITPNQYATLTIAAGDTPRGIVWTNQKIIPRRVTFEHDADSGLLITSIECEAETTGTGQPTGITVIPPQPPETNINPNIPPIPTYPPFPPGTNWFPPTIPPTPPGVIDCSADPDAGGNGPYILIFDKSILLPGETAYAYFPCIVRMTGATQPTYIYQPITNFQGDSLSNFGMTAIDSGKNTLVIGSGSTVMEFDAGLAAVSVAGFAISLDAGGGSTYSPGAIISSGTLQSNIETPLTAVSGFVSGDWYCIEGEGGPYYYDSYNPSLVAYLLEIYRASDASGELGGGGWTDSGYTFAEHLPSWGAFVQHVDGYHARLYFQATQSTYYLRVGETPGYYGDNIGTLGYIVRNAIVSSSRRILLSSLSLYNICAA
jgi:hypothetical protein